MRMAFVSISGVAWGGSEVLWVAVAKEALHQGHQVMVSVFDWQPQHPTIQELKTLGATFIYRRRFYPTFSKRLKKKIVNKFRIAGNKLTYHNYLNDFKADRILFNLGGGDEIAQDNTDLMVFVKQTQIPFSVFYHSLSKQVLYADNIVENFRILFHKATSNFFTSKMQIDLMEKQLQYRFTNASIVHHPLRTIREFPLLLNKEDKIYFCIIGSLVCRWKGQDIVLKILAKEKWLSRNWVLNIYGEGEDEFILKEIVKQSGINERVFFYGFNNDIEKILKENHLVLIPSKQDSGPIVLFEAMLAARPVVGSHIGAMPDYIVQRETGVLAEGISENDFEDALETAWINRDKWVAWGRAGNRKILAEYDFNSEKTLLKKFVDEQY